MTGPTPGPRPPRARSGRSGSLFLNVGAKPTDPWTALDVAQTARRHLTLQNTIHWIKSIAIDRDAAGASAGLDRDLSVGHYKPINSERFVNDCHEFIFHFSVDGQTPLDRQAIGVPYQDASNVTRWRRAAGNRRCRGNTWFVPYETIQNRDKDRPHPATFPPRIAEYCLKLHGVPRVQRGDGPVPGTRQQRGRRRSAWASTSSGWRSTSTTSSKPSRVCGRALERESLSRQSQSRLVPASANR